MGEEGDAKRVFDIYAGWIEDRTKLPHKYPIDIDVIKPTAPPGKQLWVYWGSAKSLEVAIKKARRALKEGLEARYVEAATGKIIATQ